MGLIVLVVIGLVKRQGWRYWVACLGAAGFYLLMQVLFNADRGVATPSLRRATGDGAGMGAVAILVIALTWGGVIMIVRKGYRKPAPKTVDTPPPSPHHG